MSPVSSPSLTHDKGLPKHLEELDKSHLEGDLRHKQPGGVLPHTDGEAKALGGGGVSPVSQLKGRSWDLRMAAPGGTGLAHPGHALTSPALPAGPGKLSSEAAHLPHLRPLPENQPSSSPLLQTTPGVKGHQRVVTLAQHISVTTPPRHCLCTWGGTRS